MASAEGGPEGKATLSSLIAAQYCVAPATLALWLSVFLGIATRA